MHSPSCRAPWRAVLFTALAPSLIAAPALAAAQTASRVATTSAASTPLPKGPRAMVLGDWYRVVNVSSPAVSPDGKRVAMTVTKAVEGENRRHSEVWVVNTAGGEPQRWTSPNAESSNPRWSPDGKYLFFSSQRAGGKGNSWAVRLDQPSGEAVQVETYPSGSMPADGSFAVFADAATPAPQVPAGDPFAQQQPMARPPFDAITRPAMPTRFDGRHVVDMTYKNNGTGFVPGRRTARGWRPQQLFRQAVGDTAKKQLTTVAYSHRSPVVSPDGRWIAFIADVRLRADSMVDMERDSLAKLPYDKVRDEAERNDADIYVIDANGGTPRKVAEWMGAESDLTWSPDGKQLAFIGRPARTKSARIYTVDVAGGQPRNLLGDWQFEPSAIDWLKTGLQFSADIGGRSAVLKADLTGKNAPKELVGGRRQIRGTSYDASGKVMAFVATSMTKPTELFVANGDGTGERQLTGFNDTVNADVVWSDAERFTYKSVGNLEIEGWLMKPYNYEAGKTYPMVIYIHGGPHSAYGEGWFDEFQNLAAQGMFVLFTNPRGSSGYGADFTARSLGHGRLRGSHEGRGHRGGAPRCGQHAHGGHRRVLRRLHDHVDRHQNRSLQGHSDRSYDHRLDVLVRSKRCAGADRVRILRQAVGQPSAVRHALPHPLRAQGEDADADRAERGGSPHADGERRDLVHVAQEAGRAGGAGPLSALEP